MPRRITNALAWTGAIVWALALAFGIVLANETLTAHREQGERPLRHAPHGAPRSVPARRPTTHHALGSTRRR